MMTGKMEGPEEEKMTRRQGEEEKKGGVEEKDVRGGGEMLNVVKLPPITEEQRGVPAGKPHTHTHT